MKRATSKAILAVLAGVGILAAQSFTGSILGTVRDSSGAVIPNAGISVVNTGTNVKTTVQSDQAGNYLAPLLPPGNYSLEASAAGFKRFVREGITITAAHN